MMPAFAAILNQKNFWNYFWSFMMAIFTGI